ELVAITAAMPDSTGLLPFSERFPDRFFYVGIAEQHATTAAAGMAMGGLRPVIAVYATFLNRAFDQVSFDVALHEQPVIFCIDRAGITGPDGASHHGLLDMVLLTKVPGMTMFAPSSYQELQQMFSDALKITSGPVAIRYPRTPAPSVPETEVGSGLNARMVSEGSDICILSVGKMLETAISASEKLQQQGRSVSVWDVRAVSPLDSKMIAAAHNHSLVVTLEDGIVEGGIGSSIANHLRDLDGPAPTIITKGVPVSFVDQGNPEDLLSELGLDCDGIVKTILEADL
ncbi:MAG: transketolase C-terminal domain-containing protein, partial [Actinomycetota bacterium]|nr:transketolase C-terminal domain-containing protein [Actinomycetota bacterium]